MRKYVKVYNNMRKYGMVCKSRRKITKKEKVRTSLPNLNKLWLTVVTRMWPKFCLKRTVREVRKTFILKFGSNLEHF